MKLTHNGKPHEQEINLDCYKPLWFSSCLRLQHNLVYSCKKCFNLMLQINLVRIPIYETIVEI